METSTNYSRKRTSRATTDILLLTVTPVEARAVVTLFEAEVGQPAQPFRIGDKTYYDLGILAGARATMVQSEMGTGGPSGALLIADEAIRELAPSAVIMVGIAFGVDENTQKIGDILVSQQLLAYELQKIMSDETGKIHSIPQGARPDASPLLLDRFRAGALRWQGPDVDFGLILSGDKLVQSSHFRQQLLKFAPDAIGGEMEGAGVYSAAYRRKVDWIVVKAICDWADMNKQQDKTARQQLVGCHSESDG